MDPRVALEKLNEMKPSDMAAFFADRGIMGCIGDGGNCPVANFMAVETGKQFFVSSEMIFEAEKGESTVTNGYVGVVDGFWAVTPPNVEKFIDFFDNGMYDEIRTDGKFG